MKVQTKGRGIYALDYFGRQVRLVFSGREFDFMRRGEFLREAGVAENDLVLAGQIHGTEFVIITNEEPHPTPLPAGEGRPHEGRASPVGGVRGKADGLFTDRPGIALGILTADCLPIFLWDPLRRAIGLVHAGWRGLAGRIAAKAVSAMKREFQSEGRSLQAAFGPAIR